MPDHQDDIRRVKEAIYLFRAVDEVLANSRQQEDNKVEFPLERISNKRFGQLLLANSN